MTYTINYQTGAGNITINGTLQDAMAAADKGAAYTQQSIYILDDTGEEVAHRTWYGVKYDADVADDSDPILFGNLGYYADWQD